MGQKTNPISLRLGIIKGWDSNWYGGKEFSSKLIEDDKIRKYLYARKIKIGPNSDMTLDKAGVSKILIERTMKVITINILTARPGLIIGKSGSVVDLLKEELKKLTKKEVQINISEIKRPEIDAMLVATTIARQIEGRIAYKRAIKTAMAAAMRIGAEGIKVLISGRLNGAEMARRETLKEGRIPLHTLRADIDYSTAEAQMSYGKLGLKVWICRGLVYSKVDYTGDSTQKQQGGFRQQKEKRKWESRDGRNSREGREGRDRNRDRFSR
ncbi:MAG: 30S ribosomal protein S3 [Bacteroidales bacterium]|nr:30S ribosomal protein S3 [Bacteroidales bacterium]